MPAAATQPPLYRLSTTRSVGSAAVYYSVSQPSQPLLTRTHTQVQYQPHHHQQQVTPAPPTSTSHTPPDLGTTTTCRQQPLSHLSTVCLLLGQSAHRPHSAHQSQSAQPATTTHSPAHTQVSTSTSRITNTNKSHQHHPQAPATLHLT